MNEVLVPAGKFQRLLDYMGRIGLDCDAIASPSGLRAEQVNRLDPGQGLPGTQYSSMYREAARQMQTLKHPIPWGAGIGTEAFELMCHSIISSKTLGDALERAQRFDRLLFPLIGYRARLERGEEVFELHYEVRIEGEDNVFTPESWDRAEYYETVAHASGLLVWYAFCGWLIGQSIDLHSVEVGAPYVNDAYRDRLDGVFHCPLHFDGEHNCWRAPLATLDQRLVHTPESLERFLGNAVFELITLTARPASTSAAIRSLIKLDFGEGLPSFEQMASNLHMSESSLRRRLIKEETSYQHIKDQVRCEIAVDHLSKDEMKISDLAELLGFTEPSSFVRSFRGWTGMTPKAYRDQARATATA